jgi:hypothetical protein
MNEAMYVPNNGLDTTGGATPMLQTTAGAEVAPQQAPLNVGPMTLRYHGNGNGLAGRAVGRLHVQRLST